MPNRSQHYLDKQSELQSLIQTVKALLIEDELKDALLKLMNFFQGEEENTEIILHLNAFSCVEKDQRQGQITQENFNVACNKLTKKVLAFVNVCLENIDEIIARFPEKKSIPKRESNFSSATKLGTHHKYTCNRSKQYSLFKKYIQAEEKPHEKLHFLYLHGGDAQEHSGLFSRFVNLFRDKEYDYVNTADSRCKVREFKIPFPKDSDIDNLKIEVPRKLFEFFEVNQSAMERIRDKNLSFALSPESKSLLSDFSNKDKVCILFQLNESRWDKNLTPKIAEHLISDFCINGLPDDTPEFYFFFSIEYDEDNTAIRQQIDEALGDGYYTHGLPELSMVSHTDIKDWFMEYNIFWESNKIRRQTIKEFFPNADEEHYMEDVQDILEDVINKINENEKDADRN